MDIPDNIRNAVTSLVAPYGESFESLSAPKPVAHEHRDDGPLWISRSDAARLISCSTDTVDDLIAAGKIRYAKLSSARCGRVLIERNSLEKFILSCSRKCALQKERRRY